MLWLQGMALPEEEVRRLFQPMASAAAYMAALGIAHRAVKLDNWLLHTVRCHSGGGSMLRLVALLLRRWLAVDRLPLSTEMHVLGRMYRSMCLSCGTVWVWRQEARVAGKPPLPLPTDRDLVNSLR